MSRVKNITRNMIYGYVGQLIILVFSFVSRSIFIRFLGIEYLGVSGLFANVLGVLALAELGVGSALTFALYNPVANNDIEAIKSIMQLYKRLYSYIAIFITVAGLSVVPFLHRIVVSENQIELLNVYYLLFLATTISSYFFAYKRALLIAYQNQYIITRFDTVFFIFLNIINIIVLIVFKNYLIYLIVSTVIQVMQNIAINIYINKLYPYLKEKNAQPLDKDFLKSIWKKIRALFLHKIAYAVINQTDYIIISSFVNIASVGLMTNYNLLILNIKKIFSITIRSILGSLGNFVTLENEQNKYKAYEIYSLLMFWLYGIVTVGFFSLADSLITLWIGKEFLIDNLTWFVIMVNFFLYGNLAALWEIKMVSGIFIKDKWVDLIAAVVNIAVSLILVQTMDMLGVFIGTLANTFVVYILRPKVIYQQAFNKKIPSFYYTTILRLIYVAIACVASIAFRNVTMKEPTWILFIVNVLFTFVVTNALFYVIHRKEESFIYIKDKVFGMLKIKKS